MIAQLSGEPVLAGDRWVVIDVHGVGYQVQVTQPALQQLKDRHETVKLYTLMAVRDDAITLYGFQHRYRPTDRDEPPLPDRDCGVCHRDPE